MRGARDGVPLAWAVAVALVFSVSFPHAAAAQGAAASPGGDRAKEAVVPGSRDEIPLPQPRPERDTPETGAGAGDEPPAVDLRKNPAALTPERATRAAAALAQAQDCEAELEQRGVAFTVAPTISEGRCGVLRPLEVSKLSSGVTIEPGSRLLCMTVRALDDWVSLDVLPEARRVFPDDTLTTLAGTSTYVCRERSSEAKISEHARGSAVDVSAFVFESGRQIDVHAHDEGSPEDRFQKAARAKACGLFKTVLGPGTDADHANHLHLDMAARTNEATYCE